MKRFKCLVGGSVCWVVGMYVAALLVQETAVEAAGGLFGMGVFTFILLLGLAAIPVGAIIFWQEKRGEKNKGGERG